MLLRSPEGPGGSGAEGGRGVAAKSHVCAVSARRCGGSTTGKLLHCAGDGTGMPGSARKSLAPGNDEAPTGWQEAAGLQRNAHFQNQCSIPAVLMRTQVASQRLQLCQCRRPPTTIHPPPFLDGM